MARKCCRLQHIYVVAFVTVGYLVYPSLLTSPSPAPYQPGSMVSFSDPDAVTSDFWVLIKFWHAIFGLYIWEFFTTLDYEWDVIRGRRPYRWSIWIYSFTRVGTLLAVILSTVGIDIATPVNCQALITFELTFGFTAFIAASLLIVLRIIAIWNKNKVVTAIALGVWVTNIAFMVHGIVRIRFKWIPEQESCMVLNPQSNKMNIFSALVTDVSLLIIMLAGLFRLHCHEGGTFGTGHLLWKQGVIWLLIATVAEATPAVFICLNLNDPFDLIFQLPALIIMSIAATRMHRSLADYVSETTNFAQVNPKYSGRTVSKTNETRATRSPGSQMEVTVQTTYVRYPTSQSKPYDSNIGMDERLGDERREQSFDNDAESGV